MLHRDLKATLVMGLQTGKFDLPDVHLLRTCSLPHLAASDGQPAAAAGGTEASEPEPTNSTQPQPQPPGPTSALLF